MAHYIPGTGDPSCHLTSGLWKDIDYLDKDANCNFSMSYYFQNLDICGKTCLESPTDMMLLKKEQKDAELDKKIEALRKKNEALMKRYQEVEEDKKRAEQEGMALQSRKGKVEDLTITINKSPTEKRVVIKKGSGAGSPKGLQEQEEGGSGIFSTGRGKRRQLLVTTPGNTKGKRVVSERVDRRSPTSPVGTKHPTEDKDELLDTTASGRNCLNSKRAAGNQHTEAADVLCHTDLDAPTSSEEQLEYLRWKREREEIDRERVARHKNSQGQWRRAWDMDKPELMFSEKVTLAGTAERGAHSRGGRNGRTRGHPRSSPAESRGNPARPRDKRGKNVPVVGSKAKGKDRLTGRARRWDTKMDEEQLQACPDTSLEEFLEELDALCEPEADNNTPDTDTQDGFMVDTSADTKAESKESANTETAGLKGSEKKVRFSEDLIQGAFEKNLCITESKASSLKNTTQATTAAEEKEAEQNVQEHKITATVITDDCTKSSVQEDTQDTSVKDLPEPPADLKEETESAPEDASSSRLSCQNGNEASNSTEQELLHHVEHMKSNTSRSTEELIDSSLSVLSLESGDTLPDHSTSTDKARENGKIV